MKKALFVTGGTVGTGLAIAHRFARAGYAVFISSRSEERAQAAAREVAAVHGVTASGYALDIQDEPRIQAIFQDIDAQDCFVETLVLNSADLGFGSDPAKGQDFFTVPAAEFQRVFETNLVWNFMLIRQAALRMRTQGRGAIVFISSNTADRAIPGRVAYCASKGGINAMSRALAVELGPYGIRCNAVLPGTIKTARWQAMGDAQIVNGQLTPIGDISDFEDIANAVWFLGSDESKNVTGAEILVDGGMSAQLFPRRLKEWKQKAQER